MKLIKNLLKGLFIIGGLTALAGFIQAQVATTSVQSDSGSAAAADSVVQVVAESQGLSLLPPDQIPKFGTFWIVSGSQPPPPFPILPPQYDPAVTPVFSLGPPGQFLVDATGGAVPQPNRWQAMLGINSATLVQEQMNTVLDLISQVQEAQMNAAMHETAKAMGLEMDDQPAGSTYTLNTNGLWLQITNVSNGLAYLNLNNATDLVYEIFSTTNLATAMAVSNWDIETEVFPGTNQNVMPFVVPELGRANLFIWAQDWTGVTENGNTVPDWWFWEYFGTVELSDTNLDGIGDTLLEDYNWGNDPNFILFSVQFTNSDFDSSSASGTINLQGGVPFYEAVLVNDTNFNDAVWEPFTSTNLTVSLSNGLCTVSVGLNGLPSNARQTWREVQLTLNTTPLTLTVTNPVSDTVSQPMIQVQGYASKPLASLTFDVSNAAGFFPNQTGYLLSEFSDTNLQMFTTNYFQCYDIALTNGLNVITLHAVDEAGNTVTTNCNVTLDYSGDTTPPALTILWPQNGTVIGGSNFTLQAQVSDAAATVTASVTDTNGDTSTVQGLVERSGLVWANNLQLAAGTNILTVTATNAAGNSSMTNLTVIQSAVSVTVYPLPAGQLNQSLVSVSGTVSDPTATVTVNGQAASVDASGNWTANNVPVSPTGTAGLNVQVTDGEGNPAASQSVYQPQPPLVVLAGYELKTGNSSDGNGQNQTVQWDWQAGGSWSVTSYQSMGGGWYEDGHDPGIPPDGGGYVPPVVTSDQGETFAPTWQNAQANRTEGGVNYQASIQTTLMIVPGGQTEGNGTALYLVQLAGMEFSDLADDPNTTGLNLGGSAEGDLPMPPEWLQINGQTLVNSGITNEDGSVVGLALVSGPAGAVVPFTVEATQHYTNNDYTFNGVQATNLTLQIFDANTGTNLSAQTNTVIVGQQINLTCQLSVTNALLNNGLLTDFQWTVPGITFSDYVANAESAVLYTNYPTGNSNVVYYWANDGLMCVQCSATAAGKPVAGQAWFIVVKPTAQIVTSGGTVVLDYYQGGIRLHCGVTDPTGMVGILFNVTNFSVPPSFAGNTNINWFQIATSQLRQEQDSSGIWYRKQGTNLCDGGVAFGTTFPYGFDPGFIYPITTDSPMSTNLANFIGVNFADTYDMYLMYQPNGGKWVPLQKVTWHWDGAGSWNGTNWVLTSHTNPGSPSGSDTTHYPTWTGNVGDLQWLPE